MQALLDQLRATVGAAHVLTDGDLSAWEQDWRKRDRGRALAVVRPGSTAEVAAVVQWRPIFKPISRCAILKRINMKNII